MVLTLRTSSPTLTRRPSVTGCGSSAAAQARVGSQHDARSRTCRRPSFRDIVSRWQESRHPGAYLHRRPPAPRCVGIEFDGCGRPGNQARAASALRAAGLAESLGTLVAAERDDIRAAAAPSGDRGADPSLVIEAALLEVATSAGDAIVIALDAGRIPFCHGGDCSALLGVVPALRGRFGAVGRRDGEWRRRSGVASRAKRASGCETPTRWRTTLRPPGGMRPNTSGARSNGGGSTWMSTCSTTRQPGPGFPRRRRRTRRADLGAADHDADGGGAGARLRGLDHRHLRPDQDPDGACGQQPVQLVADVSRRLVGAR
jgi:hypothetical protein